MDEHKVGHFVKDQSFNYTPPSFIILCHVRVMALLD